jgi:hypothetical protein
MATVKFLAITLCALALVPSGAHLMELLNKLHLPAEEYLVVQRLYRGWALSGVLAVGALLSTSLLAVTLRGQRGFVAAIIALLCLAATQVIFWSATYPVNVITHDWTILPGNWQALRGRWEYSHAASAVLNVGALLASVTAVLRA